MTYDIYMHFTGSGFRFAASLLALFFSDSNAVCPVSTSVFFESFLQRVGLIAKQPQNPQVSHRLWHFPNPKPGKLARRVRRFQSKTLRLREAEDFANRKKQVMPGRCNSG